MTTTDPSVAASTAGSSTPFVKSVVELDRVVIRLAGDSGDGMQLTGNRFTSETASFGNDLSTLPNFPAEIRAPTGTLPGVSSFQLHFADHDIMTPGDAPDVVVAMNPAALKADLVDLPTARPGISSRDRGADSVVIGRQRRCRSSRRPAVGHRSASEPCPPFGRG